MFGKWFSSLLYGEVMRPRETPVLKEYRKPFDYAGYEAEMVLKMDESLRLHALAVQAHKEKVARFRYKNLIKIYRENSCKR